MALVTSQGADTLSQNTGKVKVASSGTFKIPQLPFFYLKMTLLSVSRCGAVVMAELKSVFAVREANQSAARLQPPLWATGEAVRACGARRRRPAL